MAISMWMTTMGNMLVRILEHMAMSIWMMSTMMSTIPPTIKVIMTINNINTRPHYPHTRMPLKGQSGKIMINPNPIIPMSLKKP